jgi:hypothetical protein
MASRFTGFGAGFHPPPTAPREDGPSKETAPAPSAPVRDVRASLVDCRARSYAGASAHRRLLGNRDIAFSARLARIHQPPLVPTNDGQ